MKEQFVTYEIALALKELGFDEPCLSYWFTVNGNNPQISKNDIYFNGYKNYHDSNTIAPLWQQAFRWFREKYLLSGAVIPTTINHRNNFMEYTYDIRGKYTTCVLIGSYEEAELACLKKLIEIVKDDYKM